MNASKAAKGLTKLEVEEATRLRAQVQLDRKLYLSDNPRIEWVDDIGRTYDQMGNPNMIVHWAKQKNQFFNQIKKHLKKADHPVIDLTDFPAHIIDDVNKFIDTLPIEQAERIIKVGF